MGYYSEVALALTSNGINRLHTQLASPAIDKHVKEEVNSLLKYADIHFIDSASKAEVWRWNSIKWYSGDPEYFADIYFLEDFLRQLDDEDFRFIRIGENFDDAEVFGDFTENPFDLELARGITIRAA